MHTLAAGAIVGSVKKRIAQGDCPTEKAFDAETLEDALIEVHRLFEAEQRQREQLEAALCKHHTGIGCVNYCRTCGGHFSWEKPELPVSFVPSGSRVREMEWGDLFAGTEWCTNRKLSVMSFDSQSDAVDEQITTPGTSL